MVSKYNLVEYAKTRSLHDLHKYIIDNKIELDYLSEEELKLFYNQDSFEFLAEHDMFEIIIDYFDALKKGQINKEKIQWFIIMVKCIPNNKTKFLNTMSNYYREINVHPFLRALVLCRTGLSLTDAILGHGLNVNSPLTDNVTMGQLAFEIFGTEFVDDNITKLVKLFFLNYFNADCDKLTLFGVAVQSCKLQSFNFMIKYYKVDFTTRLRTNGPTVLDMAALSKNWAFFFNVVKGQAEYGEYTNFTVTYDTPTDSVSEFAFIMSKLEELWKTIGNISLKNSEKQPTIQDYMDLKNNYVFIYPTTNYEQYVKLYTEIRKNYLTKEQANEYINFLKDNTT